MSFVHHHFVCLLFLASVTLIIAADLPVVDIIRGYGYPCEQHYAPTSDGWMLSVQRIPHGKAGAAAKGSVLFQHGLTDCSIGSVLNSPTESLPFILADAGYDVWLGNNRGNGYSMNNTQYTSDQPQFWDFSWDEMAAFDVPGEINYILSVTKAAQISYIGHSEGTIQAFSGFLNAEVAAKVNLFVALAPVAYVGNVEAVLMKVLADLDTEELFDALGVKEFYLPDAIHKFLPDICSIDPTLCSLDIELVCGPSYHLNVSRISLYATYEPNPTSVKNMAHWSQCVRSGNFEMYDYGQAGNMQHYNQPHPPPYELSKWPTSLPVALFTGGNDYLADPADVAILIEQLGVEPMVHTEPTYAHLDPLLGVDAHTLIYPRILKLLDQYSAN